MIAGLSLAVLALLGVAAAYAFDWVKRHPAQPKDGAKPVEVAKFIVSDSFKNMKLSDKEAYLEKLRGGSPGGAAAPGAPPMDPRAAMRDLDENTRREVFEQMMAVREARMKKEAKDYFKLSKEDREAWMAKHIAEQDKRREEMRARFAQMRQQQAASQGTKSSGGTSSNRASGGGPPGGGGPDGGPGGPPPP
jgi:hypothetical protein